MTMASTSRYGGGKQRRDRIGRWMQTYSGKQFWPLDPRPEEIDIRDIAAALSKQCQSLRGLIISTMPETSPMKWSKSR
jgi:hypothetical protein